LLQLWSSWNKENARLIHHVRLTSGVNVIIMNQLYARKVGKGERLRNGFIVLCFGAVVSSFELCEVEFDYDLELHAYHFCNFILFMLLLI